MQQDPAWFVREILGSTPWPTQIDIMESVRDNERTAARSCHGIGKSYIAGQVILWFLYSFPNSIILSTAPTWRQVEKLIWKEIRSSYRKARINLAGNLLPKKAELQIIQDEWCALGLSTNDPDRFQGFHSRDLLVIVDEAAGVDEDIFEAVEGVLTSDHCRLLLLGNPTAIGGTFYEAFREPRWKTFHVAAWDTPNFTSFGITEEDLASDAWVEKISGPLPAPWLITPKWAADKYQRWGKDTPAYQARVAGNFPTGGDKNVIPLAWIEAAMERWEETEATGQPVLGVDVARFGDDKTVICTRQGSKITQIQIFSKLDNVEVAAKVAAQYDAVDACGINVDVIGTGSGVCDILASQGLPVTAVNVAEASLVLDERGNKKFLNLRAELWWTFRGALNPNPRINPDPLALPYDDDLLADLSNPRYDYNAKGQILLEPKEKMKERLGRSPDVGDAAVLTLKALGEFEWSEPSEDMVSGARGYDGPFL